MEDRKPLLECVSRYFNAYTVFVNPDEICILDYDEDKFVQLTRELEEMGYAPWLNEFNGFHTINLTQLPPKKESKYSKYHVNLILFLVTIVTTVYAGYLFGGGNILEGIAFSVSIMAILGAHELAHYLAAKKYGMDATLPYFIPAPTFVGTFGAVINIKSHIPNKNALFDLGASGPLAGFIIAIPVLIIGLYLSTVEPSRAGSIIFNPPLLMSLIASFAAPAVPEGYMLNIHPIAFAGWVGIVVTMLNLMPVGLLDGGHIFRSIFREKFHNIYSFVGIVVTIALGWIPMALIMAVMMVVFKRHPGALDNVKELSKNRKILSVGLVVVLVLCLAPAPSII